MKFAIKHHSRKTTKIELFGRNSNRFIFRKAKEEFQEKNLIPTVKYGGGSIMIWGCFSINGTGNIVCIKRIMNGEKYKININDELCNFSSEVSVCGLRYVGNREDYKIRRLDINMVINRINLLDNTYIYDCKPTDVYVHLPKERQRGNFVLTAAQKLGVFNILQNAYSSNNSFSNNDSTVDKIEQIHTAFDIYTETDLIGNDQARLYYKDLSIDVCKSVCLEIENDTCCSVIFDYNLNVCYITPVDFNSGSLKLEKRNNVNYYRRKKCRVFKTLECDFKQDKSNGSYMMTMDTFIQKTRKAQLRSPYILSDGSNCLSLYYQILSGKLSIKTLERDYSMNTLWERNTEGHSYWSQVQINIPTGYYRIVIEASHSSIGKRGIFSVFDDIKIGKCQNTTCATSFFGTDYTGKQNITVSGEPCIAWNDIPRKMIDMMWLYTDKRNLVNDTAISKNYCRNPDDDKNGAWCVTNNSKYDLEYCSIEICDCPKGKDIHRCSGKKSVCISKSLFCDGIKDCPNGEDEWHCTTPNLVCSFNSTFLCGYELDSESKVKWVRQTINNKHVLGVDIKQANEGDIATLILPLMNVSNNVTSFQFNVENLAGKKNTKTDKNVKINSHEGCVRMLMNVTKGSSLYVSKFTKDNPFKVVPLCKIHGFNFAKYQFTVLALPSGTFHLRFDAVLADKNAVIYVTNITFGDCEHPPAQEITSAMPSTINPTTVKANSTVKIKPNTPESMQSSTTMSTVSPKQKNDDVISTEKHDIYNHCWSYYRICPMCLKRVADFINFTNIDESTTVITKKFTGTTQTGQTTEYTTMSVKSTISFQAVTARNLFYEPLGINCAFTDEDTCGYRYYVSNLHLSLNRTLIVADNKNDYAYFKDGMLNNTEKHIVQSYVAPDNVVYANDWIKFISPVYKNKNVSWLLFDYYVKFMNMEIASIDESTKEEIHLFTVKFADSEASWHKSNIKLEAGEIRLVFKFIYQSTYGVVKIADILLFTKTTSYKKHINSVQEKFKSFNCNFNNEFLCNFGFINSTNSWLRIKSPQSDNSNPRGYYISTMLDKNKKYDLEITTNKFVEIDTPKCLTFYYNMKRITPNTYAYLRFNLYTNKKNTIKENFNDTLYMYSNYSNANTTNLTKDEIYNIYDLKNKLGMEFYYNNSITQWEIRAIHTDYWLKGQFTVPQGKYKLSISLYGEGFSASIDDLNLNPGKCKPQKCAYDNVACSGTMSCIPVEFMCDKISNCAYFDDEIYANCKNSTLYAEKSIVVDQDLKMENVPIPKWKYSEQIHFMPLQEIYNKTSHQLKDMVFGCTWQGMPCNFSNFLPIQTDYGRCYTFILENNKTAESGVQFGLSLTLNIEQYEYMRGLNSDAGVKLILHGSDEIPRIRDLGFAISPGTHALSGVLMHENSNLPEPWDTCGTKNLTHYDYYSLSGCTRDCETINLVKECKCRDAYMPPNINETYRVDTCNLRQVYDCILPFSKKSKNTTCICPKPCKQISYETSLSYAALSENSVNTILQDGKDELRAKYNKAIDTSDRIKGDTFADLLLLMTDMKNRFERFIGLVRQMGGEDAKSSEVYQLWLNMITLMNIYKNDVEYINLDVDKSIYTFQKMYADRLHVIKLYRDEIWDYLKKIDLISKNIINTNLKKDKVLPVLIEEILAKISIGKNLMDEYNSEVFLEKNNVKLKIDLKYENRNILKYLPLKFFIMEDCKMVMRNHTNLFGTISTTLINLSKVTNKKNYMDYFILSSMYYTLYPKVDSCLYEYINKLNSIKMDQENNFKNVEYAIKNAKPSMSVKNVKEDLFSAYRILLDKIQGYSHSYYNKVDIMTHFITDNYAENGYNSVKDLKLSMVTTIYKFINSINDIIHVISEGYMNALENLSELEKYHGSGYFYSDITELMIWNKISPSLEDTTKYNVDEEVPLWSIWLRETPLDDFLENAQYIILESLTLYTDKINLLLNSFSNELSSVEEIITSRFVKIGFSYNDYFKKIALDANFISRNFMKIDIYFKQFRKQTVVQSPGYGIDVFLSEMGGYAGLFTGLSVLSLFEIMDFICMLIFKIYMYGLTLRSSYKPPVKDDSKSNSKKNNDNELSIANSERKVSFYDDALRRRSIIRQSDIKICTNDDVIQIIKF
ncbi:hypothetical protein A3Q56_01374 [Intoshia linei]|uniref:Uncharacterized protein n=1 Tax=Intoshia linei TaxID=1819745 RepID=A0A177B984_9BILA|nr:hypothetical protein A3Q56_01374 [Intoshia linei]